MVPRSDVRAARALVRAQRDRIAVHRQAALAMLDALVDQCGPSILERLQLALPAPAREVIFEGRGDWIPLGLLGPAIASISTHVNAPDTDSRVAAFVSVGEHLARRLLLGPHRFLLEQGPMPESFFRAAPLAMSLYFRNAQVELRRPVEAPADGVRMVVDGLGALPYAQPIIGGFIACGLRELGFPVALDMPEADGGVIFADRFVLDLRW